MSGVWLSDQRREMLTAGNGPKLASPKPLAPHRLSGLLTQFGGVGQLRPADTVSVAKIRQLHVSSTAHTSRSLKFLDHPQRTRIALKTARRPRTKARRFSSLPQSVSATGTTTTTNSGSCVQPTLSTTNTTSAPPGPLLQALSPSVSAWDDWELISKADVLS
jgi:hypothetical protein